jgi:hypothetical protein
MNGTIYFYVLRNNKKEWKKWKNIIKYFKFFFLFIVLWFKELK